MLLEILENVFFSESREVNFSFRFSKLETSLGSNASEKIEKSHRNFRIFKVDRKTDRCSYSVILSLNFHLKSLLENQIMVNYESFNFQN